MRRVTTLFSGLLCAAAIAAAAMPAQAAIETNPQALYDKMNGAYAEGLAHGWTFDEHRYYASTVYATGRSYSLFRHDDPNYASVASLTVDIATALHYDPLNNDDGASWWIREAAAFVAGRDPARAAAATALIDRIDAAESGYADAARIAETDAAANVASYHGDSEARVAQVIVDLRAAAFSGDKQYQVLALAHASQPNFPLVRLPSKQLQAVYQIAQDVIDAKNADSADLARAKSVLARRDATPQLQEIGSTVAIRHSFHLSITAPADEYFGRGGLSVLGMHNLINHLKKYLDAGYGVRQTAEAQGLADGLRNLQYTYPKDFELPQLLELAIAQINRISDPRAQASSGMLAKLLVLNYPESAPADRMLKNLQAGANDSTSAGAGRPGDMPSSTQDGDQSSLVPTTHTGSAMPTQTGAAPTAQADGEAAMPPSALPATQARAVAPQTDSVMNPQANASIAAPPRALPDIAQHAQAHSPELPLFTKASGE